MKIAEHITLPLEAVSRTMGIIGQKGSGKTYTAMKVAEGMLTASAQITCLDPTGVWWGLKAEGSGPGFPIFVMGGSHGDIPLAPTAGALVADFIVTSGQSVVLDLSEFNSNAEQARFVTDFAERLFRAKSSARTPLHLLLDEADTFAPQRPLPGEQRMLGALEAIVRRGRSRGLGMTMISQRPAVLNKNVLSQCDLLIAGRVTGPHDNKALGEWTALHGAKEQQVTFLSELASLPTGTAFFWSPAWLGIFKRAKILKRTTFDSSKTPEPGMKVAVPKVAKVDIAKLSAQILATAEEAKSNDPKELKAELAKLRAELAQAREEKDAEVPIFSPKEIGLLQAVRDLLDSALGEISKRPTRTVPPAPSAPAATQHAPRKAAATTTAPVEGVTIPQQRILDALGDLACLGMTECDKSNVAVFADQSPSSSGYTNNLGRLRTAGLISYPSGGRVALTETGLAAARPGGDIRTLDQLHAAWFSKLPAPKVRILRALIEVYPQVLTKSELALCAEQSATSSGYTNNLGGLRTLGLLDYPSGGMVVATDRLFPASLRL